MKLLSFVRKEMTRGSFRRFRRSACAGFLAAALVLSPVASFAEVEKTLSSGLEAGLQKTIFLDLRDINVVDVFKFLAVQGPLNIVTSKNVQGRSTLLLRNVKIKDALYPDGVSNQLAYENRGDIIYIMTEDEYSLSHGKSFNDRKKISIRTLSNAKPSYVLAALQAVQSAIGKVIIDDDTGTVVMIDTPEKLLQMASVLDKVEGSLDMKVIKLQFAKVEDVVAQLKPQIEGKGVGTVTGDPRSNQVMISAYPERMTSAVKLVKALDTPIRAVLIEARMLQLTLNPKYDWGIDWQKIFRQQGWRNLTLRESFPIDPTISGTDTLGNVAKMSIGSFDGTDELALQFKAIKEIEDTKILATPRVMILDRQEAKVNIGDRLPYVVTTSTGTGNNVSVSEDIRFIDVGIMLNVTPTINDDGFITLKIRPEISSQTGELETPTHNKIPKVNTTFMESTVIVKDGISIILGGLMRDEVTVKNQGVPYLMDIPILGQAFRSRNESMKKTEIVIIITPRIVSGSNDVLDEPIPIKKPDASTASDTAGIDMFKVRPFDAQRAELAADLKASGDVAEKKPSRSFMGGLNDLLQKALPIKRTK